MKESPKIFVKHDREPTEVGESRLDRMSEHQLRELKTQGINKILAALFDMGCSKLAPRILQDLDSHFAPYISEAYKRKLSEDSKK